MSRTPLPPAIKFVLATMLINSIGFGIVIPSFPQLIMSLGDATLSEATGIGGLLAVVYALFQFVFGPVMGNLSDRFGRRPVLLGSLFIVSGISGSKVSDMATVAPALFPEMRRRGNKQPEMVGWAEDGGPWTPVRRGDRLFGRAATATGSSSHSSPL